MRFNTDIGYTQEVQGRLPAVYISPANLSVTNASGGVAFASGYTSVCNVCIRNNPDNISGAYIWLGSNDTPPAAFSAGFMLDVGDGRSFEFIDPSNLRVVSNINGTKISWDLLQYPASTS